MIMTNRYDELDKAALQIMMDYSDGKFPTDLRRLCAKLRIKLTPYSALGASKLSKVKSIASSGELSDGFSILLGEPDQEGYVAYAYYNDDDGEILSDKRASFTIAHEIKHVVYGERNPSIVQEDEANHFARYLLAPTPLLIVGKYKDPYEIQKRFGLTFTASRHALEAKNRRVMVHGDSLFEYEKDFLDWFFENVKKGRGPGKSGAFQGHGSPMSDPWYSPNRDPKQGGYDDANIQQ